MARLHTVAYMALTVLLYHAEAGAIEGDIQLLHNRAAYYGGFSLAIDLETNCPTGTFSCNYSDHPESEQGGPCCPNFTICTSDAVFCCPTSEDCSQTVSTTPTCGDPSWTLLSDGDVDFICCPAGMIADGAAQCAPPGDTGYSSQATYYTSEIQGNNAAPTGDGTNSAVGTAAATTSPGGGSAPSSAASPGIGSPTVGGGSTPTSGGATPSATKKSIADRGFVVDHSALALAGIFVVVLYIL